jgi:hypothetical protein
MSMSSIHQRLLASALWAFFSTPTLAQAPTQAAPAASRPDPINPQADVPAVSFVSAFADYRSAGDGQVGNWQQANRTVTRIGGWRAYAREAAAPASAPPAPAAASASGAPVSPGAASPSPAVRHVHGQP